MGVKFGFLHKGKNRLRVFVSRAVRRIFDVLGGRKGQRDAEDSVVSFMTDKY
jgi:hypothetical protein